MKATDIHEGDILARGVRFRMVVEAWNPLVNKEMRLARGELRRVGLYGTINVKSRVKYLPCDKKGNPHKNKRGRYRWKWCDLETMAAWARKKV